MPFESLSKSIKKKPNVLAGPILRKVRSDDVALGVTVWLALRKPCSKPDAVLLKVLDEGDHVVLTGTGRTVALGVNLHIVAVTANKLVTPFPRPVEGNIYRYDLEFNYDDGTRDNKLADATNNAKLAYSPWTLPSFALPPQDLNLLRLLQGSCRKPSGDGNDMLPFVSSLIEQSASNAFARPHQLMLTGDQIYADDVAFILSLLLSDAGQVLLGWGEQYMRIMPPEPRAVIDLHPSLREPLLRDAGFTSVDLRCHLIGLGEYMAMYLFVWSDVLWPSTLPTFEDLNAAFDSKIQAMDEEIFGGMVGLAASHREDIKKETIALQAFRQSLSNVRRALANVPSYMIFDDHEITDDWNMTRAFCRNVYGNDLGLRVVQNGLVAYTLCQHWGNVPEDFESSPISSPAGSQSPGAALLALIDTPQPTAANAFQKKAADYDRLSKDIRRLLAIHDAAAIKARDDNAVFHDTGSLRYNFSVEGPSHQVIFTDTRTWRSFPRHDAYTHLLTKNTQTDQFKEQILDAPDTRGRLLFVVLTTNVPTVQPFRAATRHDMISNHVQHYPDLYEAWDLPSESFDRLLVALTSKLPVVTSKELKFEQHVGQVIILSGDVHISYATRMVYRAAVRYEDDVSSRGATAVIVQLITSSLKKQTEDVIRFQREGYYAFVYPWLTQPMIRHTLTEGYVGWNFAKGDYHTVAKVETSYGNVVDLRIDRGTIDVTPTDPLHDRPVSSKVDLLQAPHYRYRFDYILPTAPLVQIPTQTIPPLPAGTSLDERKKAAGAYSNAIQKYKDYTVKNPPKVVGVNNFGEIKLDWGPPANRKVNHIVRWWDSSDSTLKATIYSVRLDINGSTDPEIPDIKARGGEP